MKALKTRKATQRHHHHERLKNITANESKVMVLNYMITQPTNGQWVWESEARNAVSSVSSCRSYNTVYQEKEVKSETKCIMKGLCCCSLVCPKRESWLRSWYSLKFLSVVSLGSQRTQLQGTSRSTETMKTTTSISCVALSSSRFIPFACNETMKRHRNEWTVSSNVSWMSLLTL